MKIKKECNSIEKHSSWQKPIRKGKRNWSNVISRQMAEWCWWKGNDAGHVVIVREKVKKIKAKTPTTSIWILTRLFWCQHSYLRC